MGDVELVILVFLQEATLIILLAEIWRLFKHLASLRVVTPSLTWCQFQIKTLIAEVEEHGLVRGVRHPDSAVLSGETIFFDQMNTAVLMWLVEVFVLNVGRGDGWLVVCSNMVIKH